MTRDEIVDFLEWAKECGQLQFPESRKVDMAAMYIKEQDAVNKTCNIPHVMPAVCVGCITAEYRNEWIEPCHSCHNGNNKQTEA